MESADWFVVREIRDGIWRILEPGHVCFWLVIGSRRAALVDTGCGVAPVRALVESLCDVPVDVTHTHHHWDHIGGDAEFERILIHPEGRDRLGLPVPGSVLDAYAEYAHAMSNAYGRWRALDERFFHLAAEEHRVRPWAVDRDALMARLGGVTATGELIDGQLIDLGDRSLRVWHTPGHSSDCLCFEVVGEGVLIGGDTVNTGPVYLQMDDSDLDAQRRSLRRLADAGERWPQVSCAHFMRTEVDPGLIEAQIRALDQLIAGDVDLTATTDCVGREVHEARFDGFSFLLAPAAG